MIRLPYTSKVKMRHGQLHGGRLPVRRDINPPLWTPQPMLVSTSSELANWAPTAPGIFFEHGKFATHLIPPHLFTFKMLTM